MYGQVSRCGANLILFCTHAGTGLSAFFARSEKTEKPVHAFSSLVDRQSLQEDIVHFSRIRWTSSIFDWQAAAFGWSASKGFGTHSTLHLKRAKKEMSKP